jgi:hypothetical protein
MNPPLASYGSTSILALTHSFQPLLRDRFRGAFGKSTADCLAWLRTYSLSGRVFSSKPRCSSMYPSRCAHGTGAVSAKKTWNS